jgi:SAM-dependent methyltransferase
MTENICKICNSKETEILVVKEKHYATFDEFEYIECSECKSLSIKDIPSELSKYYKNDTYYSLKNNKNNSNSLAKRLLKKYYWYNYITSNKLVFNILDIIKKQNNANLFKILRKTKIKANSSILDIGCGNGTLLRDLNAFGFNNLLGIEPNIEEDIYLEEKKFINKTMLEDFSKLDEKTFDLIMLNHSFEHMPNPIEIIHSIKKLAHNNTYILIRIPLSNKFAFKKYRENWVQLDAPRHLYLYSEEAIKSIFKKEGFVCLDTVYDSTDFQFWGSEQYMKDIPLIDVKSYAINPQDSIFTEKDIHRFKEEASNLNKNRNGDMASFIFKLL